MSYRIAKVLNSNPGEVEKVLLRMGYYWNLGESGSAYKTNAYAYVLYSNRLIRITNKPEHFDALTVPELKLIEGLYKRWRWIL